MAHSWCGASLIVLASATAAFAQTTQTDSTAPATSPQASPRATGTNGDVSVPTATPSRGIEEVVVTAQRRSENLQRAAVAVDVITGSTVAAAGVSSPTQLGAVVPALSVNAAGGANVNFFIRGVGNFSVNGYTDPAVAFNDDGVYVGRATSTAGFLYDLERVEVLKGPQGTLYGRNATAGAINVIPARPNTDRISGYVTGGYGNYNAGTVEAALNVPISSTTAVRIAGNFVSHDGYLSDGTSDQRDGAVRAQLLTRLTPDLTLRIAADYSHNGGTGGGSDYAERYAFDRATQSYVVTSSGLDKSQGLLDPAAQAFRESTFAGLPGRTLGPLDSNIYLDNQARGVNAELTWKTTLGTLTIIPAGRASDLDNRFDVPAFIGYIQEADRQASVEARFAGHRVSIFDYIIGAYFFDEKVKGNYTFDQDALATYQNFTSTTKSYAGFARLTANVTDRLRLVGGLRFTEDDKHFDGLSNTVLEICTVRVNFVPSCPRAPVLPVTDRPSQLPFATIPGGILPIGTTGAIASSTLIGINEPLDANRITFRAAAEYDLAPRSLLYASYETGYRSGGFALADGYSTFQPEYLDAYTLGIKNRLLANTLQLNVEAFDWEYSNQQINHTGIDLAGNTAQFTQNAGSSTLRGIEASGQYLLTENTLLTADTQYLDAHYNQFAYQQPVGNAPPFTGCAYSLDPSNTKLYNINCAGKSAYQSPRWTANFGVQQTIPLHGYNLVAEADTQYKTAHYVGFDFVPFERADAAFTSNARLTFERDDGRWMLAGYVRNIEGRRIPVYGSEFSIGSIGEQVTSPPRTYGAQATYKF